MPIIVSKPGRRYKYRQTEFWAERGMIHQLDHRKSLYQPDYTVTPVRKILLLADAMNQSVHRIQYPDERREQEKWIADMIACCREAQRQGRPDDPKTFEFLRASRRDKHILLPGDAPWNVQKTGGGS